MIAVEHILCVGSHIHFVTVCVKVEDPLLEHIQWNIPNLFTNADHISIPEAIFAKMICITVTFAWNFIDIFIMTIGISLTSQFKLFNDELKANDGVTQSFFLGNHLV